MKTPLLSVRGRLLVLSFGLVGVLGGANLLLGFMIKQNQTEQLLEQDQYRRFEIIDATNRAVEQYRHIGGEYNSARLAKNLPLETQYKDERNMGVEAVQIQLAKLASFDHLSADTIGNALRELPEIQDRAISGVLTGNEDEATKGYLADVNKHVELIEATLKSTSDREHSLTQQIEDREKARVAATIRIATLIISMTGIFGTLLTLVVIRSIIRPLQATTAAIRQVNAGQTEIDLPPVGNDEFGDMALALRQFRDQAENLHQLAYTDPLTGLGNRARLEESLQQAINRCRQGKSQLGILYLDLDKFRAVNDRWGHKGGDRYLCEAVFRLSRFIPVNALLCRYAGDSFAVLIEDLPSGQSGESHLREVSNNILRGLGEPFPFEGQLLNMSVSIGVSIYPDDGKTVEQLVSGADAAMYVAKQGGRNNIRFASSQVTGHFRRQLAVASDIRRGLEQGEFETFYQPIVDVDRGLVTGAEALLRWRHPERGLLLPGKFIHVAEESGLINKLGEECLLSVHRQTQRWKQDGENFRVSVNLSVRQLHEGKILELLRVLHKESEGVERMIDFELTESELLDATEHSQDILDEINKLGYKLGLDDFGTGYSSFSYLQRLAIDKIKVDHQFVATMNSSRQSLAIISAILALAKNLELEVVAEGIESVEQSRHLSQLGCYRQQGFFFTRALPAQEFERWAKSYERQMASARLGSESAPSTFNRG